MRFRLDTSRSPSSDSIRREMAVGAPPPPPASAPSASTAAIEREIAASGTAEDKECLAYVLHAPAGSSPRRFANSPHARDCDGDGVRADRRTAAGAGIASWMPCA